MKYPHGDLVQLFDIVDGGDGPAAVVGIADTAEYAPDYQFEALPRSGAGALVISEDGSLKWRPLPGVPLTLCERPEREHQDIANEESHHLLPASAIPAYHGFYVDGRRIELLDVVRVAQGETGKVVALISEGRFSSGFPGEQWSYLRFGFIVESSLSGLHWYRDADEDLELISRARTRRSR
ncbi:hypothetical protein [Luteibacter jiangsuensis]